VQSRGTGKNKSARAKKYAPTRLQKGCFESEGPIPTFRRGKKKKGKKKNLCKTRLDQVRKPTPAKAKSKEKRCQKWERVRMAAQRGIKKKTSTKRKSEGKETRCSGKAAMDWGALGASETGEGKKRGMRCTKTTYRWANRRNERQANGWEKAAITGRLNRVKRNPKGKGGGAHEPKPGEKGGTTRSDKAGTGCRKRGAGTRRRPGLVPLTAHRLNSFGRETAGTRAQITSSTLQGQTDERGLSK